MIAMLKAVGIVVPQLQIDLEPQQEYVPVVPPKPKGSPTLVLVVADVGLPIMLLPIASQWKQQKALPVLLEQEPV